LICIKDSVRRMSYDISLDVDVIIFFHRNDLKNHFVDPSCAKPLDTVLWNNDSLIKLLMDNYPKDDRSYDDKTSFSLRMQDIKMLFDYSNPDIENQSIMAVTQLLVEYIPDDSALPRNVTDSQQKESVLLLIKRWPQAIQTSFNSFCTSHNRINLEVYDFLENLPFSFFP
jgi:hypothetical protein